MTETEGDLHSHVPPLHKGPRSEAPGASTPHPGGAPEGGARAAGAPRRSRPVPRRVDNFAKNEVQKDRALFINLDPPSTFEIAF